MTDIEKQIESPSEPPSWKDAPTVPGLWLTDTDEVMNVTDVASSKWMVDGKTRWFGPIPEDVK